MDTIKLKSGECFDGNNEIYKDTQIRVCGKDITIKNTVIDNDGICVYSNYNCSNLKIENCTFISKSNNCIKIIADNLDSVIDNITFDGCKLYFSRIGMELQNHKNENEKIKNVTIKNCVFEGFADSTSYRYGISLSGYGRYVSINDCIFNCEKGIELVGFSNVIIEGNKIDGNKETIISSNSRPMDNIHILNNKLNGKLFLYGLSDSVINGNEISCSYVEIKKSKTTTLNGNEIESTGHYSVMLNDAHDNIVKENKITQKSKSNWSVIRCYGSDSTNNVITKNTITREKKGGKLYDEYNGAHDNKFSN